jgi:hypothetical protein
MCAPRPMRSALMVAAAVALVLAPGGVVRADKKPGPHKAAPAATPGPATDAPIDRPFTATSVANEKLSANEYVMLDPFVVPLVDKELTGRQFTLMIALKLKTEGDREMVLNLRPKLRDSLYRMLFRLVTFRRRAPRIPTERALNRELMSVTRRITAGHFVESVYIRYAFVGQRP